MTHIGVGLVGALTTLVVGVTPAVAAPDRSAAALAAAQAPTVFANVAYPSGAHAARAAGAVVTGAVTGETGRRVWLQSEADQGWVTLGEAVTGPGGVFELPAPTFWVHDTTMRVYAPATDDFEAGASPETGQISVTRTYRPRKGRAFSRMSTAARWNPCREIIYKVNKQRMPKKGLADTREAFERISEGTGLRFRYAGPTTYVGWKDGKFEPIEGADIGIAWATPAMVPGLQGSTIGYGGGSSSGGFYSSGAVSLDSTANLQPGFQGGRKTRTGTLLVHEIGHVVGLGHVDDTRQVMSPILTRKVGQPAKGDLRGLDAVGAERGCPSADQTRSLATSQVLVQIAD